MMAIVLDKILEDFSLAKDYALAIFAKISCSIW